MFRSALLLVLTSLCTLASHGATPPDVVVSIKPVHALVSAVMEGVARPHLLLSGAENPHSYVLRPSDRRRLAAADLVVWTGPGLEGFLQQALRDGGAGRSLAVAGIDGLRLLPMRRQAIFDAHGHAHADAGATDPHVWLDPDNAARIGDAVAAALAGIDPAHAGRYRDNAKRLAASLALLDGELSGKLEPIRGVTYLIVHDAYQYMEDRYKLRALSAVHAASGRAPGARHVHDLRALALKGDIACVFSDARFGARYAETIADGTPVRIAGLDPIGVDIEAGPDAYAALMRRLADSLAQCLAGAGAGRR